jgi:arylsulfatase A
MAAEGTRFTDFSVAAALCTPSRAALMTGKYPGRTGLATGVLRPDAQNGLRFEELTIAEVVKSSGYATGCIGKWHLGFVKGMRPMDQGFDSYYGVLHNLDKFETVVFEKEGGMPVLRGDAVERRPAVPAEMTELYTIEALKFIEANREKPFFLYLAHAMPHLPFDASPRFKGKSARGLYGDVIEELDDSTGRILQELRSTGLAERTLVIFTSDNGPERRTPGTAAPLSGTKHTVHEGGLRVPCLAWWPGHVPGGRESRDFIATLDLLPTFAALSGASLPKGLVLDGFDISPVLLGKPDAHSPRTTLYSLYGLNKNRKESIRSGFWKLHLTEPPALYNLEMDVGETRDIASGQPDRVGQLTELARKIRTETRIPPQTR